MNRPMDGTLDPRAWLLWAFAASLPPLLGRNPWPLLATLLAVAGVRIAWSRRMSGGYTWSLLVRLAILFALIGIVFNVLTVRAGDRVIGELPDQLPLFGGELTLNAVVFGTISGLALVLLVTIRTTGDAPLDWAANVRLQPPGLTTVAVAGSVAFAFVPQTAVAFHEIREAQSARGHHIRGARDLLPIVVPMVAGGLERAITLSEALESRGFGAPVSPGKQGSCWVRYAGALALGLAALSAFALASGRTAVAAVALIAALLLLLPAVRSGRATVIARTRYRAPHWSNRDSAVALASTVVIVCTILALQVSPESLRYEPYPHLTLPHVSLPLIAILLALLTPALIAPPVDAEGRG
jgi:energy-coupling factor transport system permease protein